MKDYRLPEHREEYFTALYRMNLEHRVMPGCVYMVMPELVKKYNLDTEQRLWLATINGLTQHIVTSWRIFKEFPEIPSTNEEMGRFRDWFNSNWDSLRFDDDRKWQKKETPAFVFRYQNMVREAGSQEKLLTGDFTELWNRVTCNYHSFGRLASFSFLEYVQIMASIDDSNYGAVCDNLFFEDKSGSRSHRNGMFFLLGMDDKVWDKRLPNGQDGDYGDMNKLATWLTQKSNDYLRSCGIKHKDLGYFTFESNLCTTKNGLFGRRHPGCYADMFFERIKWYDDRGFENHTKVFKEMREDHLPEWLRCECDSSGVTFNQRAAKLKETGFPDRGEHFL